MRKGFTCTRPVALAAALSAAAAAVSCLVGSIQSSRTLARHQHGLQEERGLNAQIAGESDYDASRLNRVRDEVRSFQVQLGPRDAWEQVARIFAARWTLEVSSRDDREGYSTQSGSFRMQSPTVADWREIVDTVAAAEKAPCAAVTDFEMKAGGDRIHPAIDLVRIGVSIRSHPAGEKGKIP